MSPCIRDQKVRGCLVNYSSSKMARFTFKHLIPSLCNELLNCLEDLHFGDFSQPISRAGGKKGGRWRLLEMGCIQICWEERALDLWPFSIVMELNKVYHLYRNLLVLGWKNVFPVKLHGISASGRGNSYSLQILKTCDTVVQMGTK